MNKIDLHKAIILFDGICSFCNASVNFIIKHDRKNYFLFTPLQSETGQQLLQQFKITPAKTDSIILIENDKAFTYSTAILRIAKKLNGLYFLLYSFVIVPSFMRDAVYKLIAKNRYKWFGKKESCMIPTADIKKKFIS